MKTLSAVVLLGLSVLGCATAPKPLETPSPTVKAPAQASSVSASTLAPSALEGFLGAPRGGCREEDPVEAALKKKGEPAKAADCATGLEAQQPRREASADGTQ